MAVISAFRHLSSYDAVRFNQDRVVRRVLSSSWRRGPDKRSTNGKTAGKMAFTSPFRHLSFI
jgi:hypothetical protein